MMFKQWMTKTTHWPDSFSTLFVCAHQAYQNRNKTVPCDPSGNSETLNTTEDKLSSGKGPGSVTALHTLN